MADSYVQLPLDQTGKKEATKTRTQGADTVHDQMVLFGDGTGTTLGVSGAPVRTDPTGTTTQPVSGTVTANLAAGTNNIGDVDVLSLPAIPAGNNNIGDVDIASALPAGTNAIGKLAANSGVDIGDVDVTSLPAIPAGTNNIGDVDVLTMPGVTNADATTTGSFTAGSQNIDVTCTGYATAIVQFSGTYGGFIPGFVPENGAGLFTGFVSAKNINTGVVSGSPSLSANTNYFFAVNVAALETLRIQSITFASGTCNVRVTLSAASPIDTALVQVDTEISAAAAAADGFANPTTGGVLAFGMRWNGATWDRERANYETSGLASAARTTTTNSSDLPNYNFTKMIAGVSVTSAGTGSISFKLQGKNSLDGTYYDLFVAQTALTTNGNYTYEIAPIQGPAIAGGITARLYAVLPRVVRIAMVHNNANTITYSVNVAWVV